MLSNYPPGVSGREYEIAGPDREESATYHCSTCGHPVKGTVEFYGSQRRYAHVYRGKVHLEEWEDWEPDDYEDELYELEKDRRLDAEIAANDRTEREIAAAMDLGAAVDSMYEDRFETASDGGEL